MVSASPHNEGVPTVIQTSTPHMYMHIMAIMYSDGIDAPKVKRKDVFGEIVHAADKV